MSCGAIATDRLSLGELKRTGDEEFDQRQQKMHVPHLTRRGATADDSTASWMSSPASSATKAAASRATKQKVSGQPRLPMPRARPLRMAQRRRRSQRRPRAAVAPARPERRSASAPTAGRSATSRRTKSCAPPANTSCCF